MRRKTTHQAAEKNARKNNVERRERKRVLWRGRNASAGVPGCHVRVTALCGLEERERKRGKERERVRRGAPRFHPVITIARYASLGVGMGMGVRMGVSLAGHRRARPMCRFGRQRVMCLHGFLLAVRGLAGMRLLVCRCLRRRLHRRFFDGTVMAMLRR